MVSASRRGPYACRYSLVLKPVVCLKARRTRFSVQFLLRNMLPLMLQHEVATEEELGVGTFDQRYREEVLGQGSIVRWVTCVGA